MVGGENRDGKESDRRGEYVGEGDKNELGRGNHITDIIRGRDV